MIFRNYNSNVLLFVLYSHKKFKKTPNQKICGLIQNRNFKQREVEPVVRSVIHVNELIERYVEAYKNEVMRI